MRSGNLSGADERVLDGGITPVGLDVVDIREHGERVLVRNGVRLRQL